MKTIITTLLFLSIGIANLFSQNSESIDLTITFTITKYNEGVIYVALYNNEENYMKTAYKSIGANVKNNKATIKLENIKKGSYSFSYYHDVNNNKKLDKNFMGIPKEPYGFSNNQLGRFGPPSFNDSKFFIDKNSNFEINIK